jgi:hypothetical protein
MSDMDYGWNEPAPATKEELVRTLEDVLECIKADDSFEGFLEWSMAGPDGPCSACHGSGQQTHVNVGGGRTVSRCDVCDGTGDYWTHPHLKGADFGLTARYRIGNSMGQGGLRTFIKERS